LVPVLAWVQVLVLASVLVWAQVLVLAPDY